jgi:shikimate dehydrogenase
MEYGLIGGKLSHSYSKIIHETAGGYLYELLALPTEQQAREFLEKREFRAVNVTIPYKRLALACCDEVEPRALAIGAVNTVVNRGGRLYGYNTDYAGFAWLAQRHGISFRGKNVLVLGTGGTHHTVSAVCRDGGAAQILSAGRTGSGGSLTYAQAMEHSETEILINATPAGMYPETGVCLVDLKAFPNLQAVLDVVYNPFYTELLLRARELGVPGWCGFEMLVSQAIFAAEKFTDKTFPEEQIADLHRELKRDISNVSLIGMPGCGKSSIGSALANALGKTLIDLDLEIEKAAGMPVPDIFTRQGEAAFRRYEAQAAARFGKENHQVIACGGGIVKTPGNVRQLRQNGPVLWIRRPVEALPMAGRPLSTGRVRLHEMEQERCPLYEAAADAVVENTGTFRQAVDEAFRTFEEKFEG